MAAYNSIFDHRNNLAIGFFSRKKGSILMTDRPACLLNKMGSRLPDDFVNSTARPTCAITDLLRVDEVCEILSFKIPVGYRGLHQIWPSCGRTIGRYLALCMANFS